MRVSWKWLSELVELPSGFKQSFPDAQVIADLLVSRGLEVEAIENLQQGFESVITAQILEKARHPQADRLSLCTVSIGSGDSLQIVCGAQNMKAGDKVALAQIGALLPNGIKIEQSKIRGEVSYGMLCSEEELKLKDSSEGILILPPETPLGVPLAQILERDDVILHLKVTANRGDCLSHVGIAREISSALGGNVKFPGTSIQGFSLSSSSQSRTNYQVNLNSGESCRQFHGCIIRGVKVGPSPRSIASRLESLGIRSINNVVDASNWVLLEFGNPTHAYDADRISGKQIEVRFSHPTENLPLLDGQTVSLTGKELVIADQKNAISLAGVMGGGNSEVQNETKNIFLECAEFDPTLVRRTSIQFQRRTEASHRFEKGIDPFQLPRALKRLAELIVTWAGGEIIEVLSEETPSFKKIKALPPNTIQFGLYEIQKFLGFEKDQEPLTLSKMKDLLLGLNFQVNQTATHWVVSPPSYRLDIQIKEDVAEEIARCLGYDKIPSTIPVLTGSPHAEVSAFGDLNLMNQAKESLASSGLNETINYSFTSKSWLNRFKLNSFIHILNPLSEEHEYLVPSLVPGLVRNAIENWNHHFGSEPLPIRLFELRPTFFSKDGQPLSAIDPMTTGVQEKWKLALLMSGPRYAEALRNERGEVDFFDLKAVIEQLFKNLGTKGIRYQPLASSRVGGNPLFHPGQSAEILVGNAVAGYFGQLHPSLVKDLKVRNTLWIAELDWNILIQYSRKISDAISFKPWPTFPQMERDFALLVREEVTVDKICQLAMKAGKPLVKNAKVFDIYRGSQVTEGMTSVAVRVIFYDESRSLTEVEAETASARILETWKKELGAQLRS